MAYIGNAPGSIRQGRRAVYEFTSTSNQTAFSGVDDNGLTLDLLQANDNDVYLNGVRLIITDDYTISGDILTLVSGAAAGDKLIVMTQDEIANDASYSKAASDSRYINYDGDIVNGTIQMGGSGNNITFADNNKAIFGSELEIYSDATHARIREYGSGQLKIQGDNMQLLTSNGASTYLEGNASTSAVTLYHASNSPRLSTTATGIDVNGTVSASTSAAKMAEFNSSHTNHGYIVLREDSADKFYLGASTAVSGQTGAYTFYTQSGIGLDFNTGGVGSPRMRIDSSGNVGIGTTSPSAILDVVGPSARPTSLAEFDTGSTARFRSDASNADSLYIAENASGTSIQANDGAVNSTTAKPLALQPFGGNVGIGTQASAPATKLEVAGTTKAEQYLLDAVAKDISDTAVDVFIYDTRKDSDGGAWRKRTQHTSWYNETLNTATRGSRKEFPAVAVIVAEGQKVTIYDGDDPNVPMWMEFNVSGGTEWQLPSLLCANTVGCNGIAALNGIITSSSSPYGYRYLNFVSERSEFRELGYYRLIKRPIIDRNAANNINPIELGSSGHLPADACNDVAMTVLPNAPIDAATGLPVPTIAVATAGGISVIKDDGTVADITESANNTDITANVEFLENGQLVFRSDGNTDFKWIGRINLPKNDINYSYVDESKMPYVMYSGGAGTARLMLTPPYAGDASTATTAFTSYKDNVIAGTIKGFGQGTTDPTVDNTYNGNLVNYTSSSYNTGWMNGDIKLATLSDTDDTDVTGSNLILNGDFSSNSGWTNLSGSLYTISGGKLNVSSAGSNVIRTDPLVNAIVGKTYVVEFTVSNYVTGTLYVNFGNIWVTGGYHAPTNGTYSFTFTPTSTTYAFSFYTASFDGSIDNVVLREAEPDRSVNGNGLQVFGTVTKNPVATGADLVAYSGFSTTGAKTNYLHQPYNSDLDFDTSFCFMGWVKVNAAVGSQDQHFFDLSPANGSGRVNIYWNHNSSAFQITPGNGGTHVVTQALVYGEWHHLVCLANASSTQIYLNGTLSNTSSGGFNHSLASDAYLTIGTRYAPYSNSAYGLNGSLALIRLSKTTPSPEQIKKIYEDEKVLFQENAKATLYGSSDAVTALAYDDTTELLHVGTSAGRSVFQGLRRIDNTTDAVGAAISASNGMVAED